MTGYAADSAPLAAAAAAAAPPPPPPPPASFYSFCLLSCRSIAVAMLHVKLALNFL